MTPSKRDRAARECKLQAPGYVVRVNGDVRLNQLGRSCHNTTVSNGLLIACFHSLHNFISNRSVEVCYTPLVPLESTRSNWQLAKRSALEMYAVHLLYIVIYMFCSIHSYSMQTIPDTRRKMWVFMLDNWTVRAPLFTLNHCKHIKGYKSTIYIICRLFSKS